MSHDIEKYIRSFFQNPTKIMDELEKKNHLRNDIQPPIEPEIGQFLSLIIRSHGVKRMLEIGTGNGYSALWFCDALPTDGHLTTIDSKERLHKEAVEIFRQSGYTSKVTSLFGDAAEIVSEMVTKKQPSFDFIFQDSGKYLYPIMLNDTIKLLKPGGLIVADDTLFKVNNSVRDNLGRHTHAYNEAVFADKRLFSSILPIGHGLTIGLKLHS